MSNEQQSSEQSGPNNQVKSEIQEHNVDPIPSEMNELASQHLDREFRMLSTEETIEAKAALVNARHVTLSYIQKQRKLADPLMPHQIYALTSFIPSKGATPDKNGVFGLMRVRGTFSSLREADAKCDELIRTVDSTREILISLVGRDCLLAHSGNYIKETREIDLKKKSDQIMRDHAQDVYDQQKRERAEMDKKQNDMLASSKRASSKKKSSDEKKAENDGEDEDDEDDPMKLNIDETNDVDMYTSLRVKNAQLMYYRAETIQKYQEILRNLEESVSKIEKATEAKPEFGKEFLAKYEQALQEIGQKKEQNPIYQYFSTDLGQLRNEVQHEWKHLNEITKLVKPISELTASSSLPSSWFLSILYFQWYIVSIISKFSIFDFICKPIK